MTNNFNNPLKLNIKLMGTYINITIYDYDNKDIIVEVENLLHHYNLIFSMYDAKAELYNLNKHAFNNEIKVSDDLFNLIEIGKYHSVNSNLNICIAPIVNLWNIGFSNNRVPDDIEISKALKLTNPNDIILNSSDKSILFKKEGMQIDLGALAKGYIADKIKEYLESKDVKSAIINLGGNIVTLGFAIHRKDLNFRIGLQNPRLPRGNHLLDLAINDMSIVTSGKYERNFKQNNKIYHHILNPKNGYPIETNMASITIISDKSIDGEIWTSKLFAKSYEEIDKELMKYNDLEAIIIYDDNTIEYTKGVEKYILERDQNDKINWNLW